MINFDLNIKTNLLQIVKFKTYLKLIKNLLILS